ncbi:hypothetical protein YC2023_095463 [Brassica napus]
MAIMLKFFIWKSCWRRCIYGTKNFTKSLYCEREFMKKPVEEGKRHAAHHVSERPALNEHVSEHESDPSTGTSTKTRRSFTDGEDERRKKPFRKNSLHRSSNRRVTRTEAGESDSKQDIASRRQKPAIAILRETSLPGNRSRRLYLVGRISPRVISRPTITKEADRCRKRSRQLQNIDGDQREPTLSLKDF